MKSQRGNLGGSRGHGLAVRAPRSKLQRPRKRFWEHEFDRSSEEKQTLRLRVQAAALEGMAAYFDAKRT